MEFSECFPIWNKLNEKEREVLLKNISRRTIPKGTLIHDGYSNCDGIYVIFKGQLRSFITSEDGREITIYRLLERDMCLFSAACILRNIQFCVSIEAEKDSEFWVIAPSAYKQLMEESAVIANYTNDLLASRFSDVMWVMEQVLWKSFDKRLSAFLLEESALESSDTLKITHEKIAAHLGSAREVVTRMLKFFQNENMVSLTRGTIELKDKKKLAYLAGIDT